MTIQLLISILTILGIILAVVGGLLLIVAKVTYSIQKEPICAKCGGCVWIVWRPDRWDCINLVKKGNKIVECGNKIYFI